ncbi:DUF429 domain-containing protein [Leeuwenhoekiella polynyae]|uniref:Putative RNase H-like nuclease n=1 Tax=Leeuwenhoekiella polynyae TaxID=1550906 RepID=A0A4Q0NW84_9FLAO|nr:DUF429 domain-containing protein [Leeuwenhoekiella polynyae]RXG14742.1 putative RNase H-like nuclease [Leeuwenhoekiella polynyae]
MILGGIDGCKYGWVVITKSQSIFQYFLIKKIEELTELFKNQKARFFIDIPIGLSSREFTRTVDTRLRSELGPRSSTVFNAPCRPAAYESDRQKAKELNIQIEGKSLSEQTLNIKDRIQEVDKFILKNNAAIELLESHPEICFKYLNHTQIIHSKKSDKTGIRQRLSLLKKYEPGLEKIYNKILEETKRKDVKRDDSLDALCLCISNALAYPDQTSYIEDLNKIDKRQIPIKVAFYDSST